MMTDCDCTVTFPDSRDLCECAGNRRKIVTSLSVRSCKTWPELPRNRLLSTALQDETSILRFSVFASRFAPLANSADPACVCTVVACLLRRRVSAPSSRVCAVVACLCHRHVFALCPSVSICSQAGAPFAALKPELAPELAVPGAIAANKQPFMDSCKQAALQAASSVLQHKQADSSMLQQISSIQCVAGLAWALGGADQRPAPSPRAKLAPSAPRPPTPRASPVRRDPG